MSAPAASPKVLRLAAGLGLTGRGAPAEAIVDYCKSRVADWLRGSPAVSTPAELEDLVCGELGLKIEEFDTDERLDAITRRYVDRGEFVFKAEHDRFLSESDVYATLIQLDRPDGAVRFVALIDCRGELGARRFFSRWHEIAHLLTLVGRMPGPAHRSSAKRDAVEQLMDKIAGEIGFFEPLVKPVVDAAVADAGGTLDFGVVDRVRAAVCPDASLQATLIAVVRMAPVPALSIEAGLGLKKEEQEMADRPGLFPGLPPEPKLRALRAGGNEHAKLAGIRINPNMRVPDISVIATLFRDPAAGGVLGTITAEENLSIWTHSDGRAVGDKTVRIQARRRGDQVVALVTLAEP